MKLCIALDMASQEENLLLAQEVRTHFRNEEIWLKVGLRSFVRDGKEFVRLLQDMNFRIFLDLKVYDIPNTMLDCVRECHNIGVDMLTVHASCGSEAMQKLTSYITVNHVSLLLVAVSALTSFDDASFRQIYNTDIASGVRNLAQITYQSGIHGLVCSIKEVSVIKDVSQSLLAVTPGIRFDESNNDDQKRVASVKEAKRLGSDFIVVGRPIYHADDKKKVIQRILNDIALSVN